MRHYKLNRDECLAGGYTDLFVIYRTDLTSSVVVGATAVVILCPLAVGDLVMNNTLLEVVEPAAGLTTALATINAPLGMISASSLLAAGSRYYASSASTPSRPTLSAGNLTFSLAPDAGEAVGAITAGEFRVWASISRQAQRNQQM